MVPETGVLRFACALTSSFGHEKVNFPRRSLLVSFEPTLQGVLLPGLTPIPSSYTHIDTRQVEETYKRYVDKTKRSG
jgi:hypothetical protein